MSDSQSESSSKSEQYVVVARRYRPKSFTELVGQGHIAQALENAISTNRVGHAYLFTGARGVGKTSTARIFAKCLNCETGPTGAPCGQCDACQAISSGDDVDVLEIDGASNRGIDEIRQLRSNVNIRPSRSRNKIYIIDEVHMLTTPAFNALLKTLEEPPEHVKFIFCTTDPEKIPITVLSRCQRFDFAPVQIEAIVERLRHIVDTEGVEADDEALHLLSRRANGSMRDSQSLLEQLLSFCSERITADDVHQMLGTAKGGQLAELAQVFAAHDTAGALKKIDELVTGGTDPGQLTEQLLGWFRDMLAASVGCDAELMLHCGTGDFEVLAELSRQTGPESILAVTQILDETLTRMRLSGHPRTLLEMAVVRICRLEQLDQLADLIARIQHGQPIAAERTQGVGSPPPEKTVASQKKSEAAKKNAPDSSETVQSTVELTTESAKSIWRQAIDSIGDMTADFASHYDSIAISAPNQLVVSFKAEYTLHKERCEHPNRRQRLEQAIGELTGQNVRIDFQVLPSEAPSRQRTPPPLSKRQRIREVEKHPLVREAMDKFDAEVVDLGEDGR